MGGGGGGGRCVCSLGNYSVAYEETQSNRVSDFRDFVCSLFPKAILFYFYFFSYFSSDFDQISTGMLGLSRSFISDAFHTHFAFSNKSK